MHEMSIVQALIQQVHDEVERSGHGGRVVRLDLLIGRLSGVNSDSIRFAFEVLSEGTIVEQAEVNISQPKATCCCRACNARADIDRLQAHCPSCGSDDVSIQGGRELVLQTIELED